MTRFILLIILKEYAKDNCFGLVDIGQTDWKGTKIGGLLDGRHNAPSLCLLFVAIISSALLWTVVLTLWRLTTYTEGPGGNVPDFGRMFLTLKYTDITQNTYIHS